MARNPIKTSLTTPAAACDRLEGAALSRRPRRHGDGRPRRGPRGALGHGGGQQPVAGTGQRSTHAQKLSLFRGICQMCAHRPTIGEVTCRWSRQEVHRRSPARSSSVFVRRGPPLLPRPGPGAPPRPRGAQPRAGCVCRSAALGLAHCTGSQLGGTHKHRLHVSADCRRWQAYRRWRASPWTAWDPGRRPALLRVKRRGSQGGPLCRRATRLGTKWRRRW